MFQARTVGSFLFAMLVLGSAPAFPQERLVTGAGSAIVNFHAISAGLYRGGNPIEINDGEGLRELAKLGVKTVVDLQGGDLDGSFAGAVGAWMEPGEDPSYIEREERMARELGMSFYSLPLNSHAEVDENEESRIRQALQILADADRLAHPIYLHCEYGVDRTGLVVALHRVLNEKMSPQQAYQEWLDLGHGDSLHQLFTHDLDDYFEKVTGYQVDSVPEVVDIKFNRYGQRNKSLFRGN